MIVVLSSTYLAILCWGLLLDYIYEYLRAVGPFTPVLFFTIVAAAAIVTHLATRSGSPPEPPQEGAEKL
jgi:hypothetical protein